MKKTTVVLTAVLAMSGAASWALDAQTTTGTQGQGAGAAGQQQGAAQQPQQAGAGQAQQGRGGGRQAGPPSMGGGQCSANPLNCPDAPNPLPKADTVWLEEMTWMD